MSLQVGDVVRLKSGGPAMTVVARASRLEPAAVDCAWFGAQGVCATASFPVMALERERGADAQAHTGLQRGRAA